jgi:mycothiol synthase
MTLSWQPLAVETVAEWAELVNALAKADGTEEYYEVEDLGEELESAGFDAEHDSLSVWQDGRMVGFGKLWASGNLGADGRATVGIDGGVHPDHRGRGIGRQLMDWIEPRAHRLGAERHPGTDIWLRAFGGLEGASVRPLLEHRGFELVRHFHELARPLAGSLPPAPSGVRPDAPDHADVRPYRPELAEPMRLAHNEAFAGHWASSPRTEQNWRELVESRAFRPECSFVSLASDGLVDAYVICRQWVAGELYVELVGTRPRARGRGLAKACLSASLRAGAEGGYAKAGLTVDAQNATGAGRLYESMGFQPVRVTAAYSKLLPAST